MIRRVQLLSKHISSSTRPISISKMSTFTLPNSDFVPISLVKDLSKDQLLEFPAFKVRKRFLKSMPKAVSTFFNQKNNNWISTLQQNLSLQTSKQDHEFHASPYKLRKIDVQSVDWFGGGKKLGFVKLTAQVSNDDGESLPGSVFLRGPSVGMMVILQPDDLPKESQEERHVILTVQPRIPAGSLEFPELPAGMVDDSGTFSGAAAKEIKEELGLEIPADELINLTELAIPPSSNEKVAQAMFPSAGGCDEYVPLFLHLKKVPRDQLKDWTGKLTGLRDEGEKITLKLVKLEDLWREGARDSKALGAWALYEGLRKEGKL